MPSLKTVILCLLLLAIPLKGFTAAQMTFCGGHGEGVHASDDAQGHAAHHTSHPADAVDGDDEVTYEWTAQAVDDAQHWNCHCSACAICCAAAGMTPSSGLVGSFIEPSRTRPITPVAEFQGRIPPTLERPPLAPRPTRVA